MPGSRRQRRKRRNGLWGAALCSIVAAGAAGAAEESGDAYAAVSAAYTQGNFGTHIRNELYTLTPEIGYVADDYDLSASLPLQSLRVSGDGGSISESGIGDAVLRGGRRLWRDAQGQLSLNGALSIKLATGDESKGLGSGATDVSGLLSIGRKMGAYSFTVLAGYTEVGEPAGVTYDNVVSYGVGVNRSFARTNIFASLQGQTSVLPGGTPPLDLDLGFFRLLSAEYVFTAHTFVGLSDGSPDGGVGIGFVRWF
jgi:hypothetical protein